MYGSESAMKGGIFVMKTVDAAQVPQALRMQAAVAASADKPSGVAERAVPRRHHNIPLWFVLGREEDVPVCTIAVSAGKRTGPALGDTGRSTVAMASNGPTLRPMQCYAIKTVSTPAIPAWIAQH